MEKIPPVSDLTNLNSLNINNLYIPVHIKAEFVNGEKFDDFLSSIVMKHLPAKIPQAVFIKGVNIKTYVEYPCSTSFFRT